MAKVKFDLNDELRLKAYYYLQLDKMFCERQNVPFPDWSFDKHNSIVAELAFGDYLDKRIQSLETILEFKKGEINAQENEASERQKNLSQHRG